MNILILQGSPRANGNTAWMAEEYRKAAEAAGHTVTLVDVAHKKIAGCMACEYCHGKGNGACIQKDDMQELYPLLAEAEVLVLAAPIYYFTMSAQIQAPIQRIIPPACTTVQSGSITASSVTGAWKTPASSRPRSTNRRRTRRAQKSSTSSRPFDATRERAGYGIISTFR